LTQSSPDIRAWLPGWLSQVWHCGPRTSAVDGARGDSRQSAAKMAATRLTMKLIKATHATNIAAALAAASVNGSEAKTEAAAVSELSALRLSGLGLGAIENLEPFDRCEALYLDHNEIIDLEV